MSCFLTTLTIFLLSNLSIVSFRKSLFSNIGQKYFLYKMINECHSLTLLAKYFGSEKMNLFYD